MNKHIMHCEDIHKFSLHSYINVMILCFLRTKFLGNFNYSSLIQWVPAGRRRGEGGGDFIQSWGKKKFIVMEFVRFSHPLT